MNSQRLTLTLSTAVLIALSSASIALAQTPEEPTALDTITVVAPRITYQLGRESSSLRPVKIEVAEKSAIVRYGDLDLSRTADLYVLEERVSEAADRVCTELAELYPAGQPDQAACVRRATSDAMAQVRVMSREAAKAGSQ